MRWSGAGPPFVSGVVFYCIVIRVVCGRLQDSLFLHGGEQGTGARYRGLGLLLSTSTPAFGFSRSLVMSEVLSSVADHNDVDISRYRHYNDNGGISFVDRVGQRWRFLASDSFTRSMLVFFKVGM